MIDLHSHILPALDDGAKDMAMSLEIARLAVADGTTTMACTPHVKPGKYENSSATILPAIEALQAALAEAGIPLKLVAGADVHVAPDLVERLLSGEIPTLAGSRYFLFEPPHAVCPPNLDKLAEQAMSAGYIPVLTHPERLTWIERDYAVIERLADMGVAVQLTAASLTGRFGDRAVYWSKRMLQEGKVDLLASDTHSPKGRPPEMSPARDFVAKRWGADLALQLLESTPNLILSNALLPERRIPERDNIEENPKKSGGWKRIFRL